MTLRRTALLLSLVFAACGNDPKPSSAPPDATATDSAHTLNPFAEPARRALRIELGLDSYRRVEGTWTTGDATSTVTAYFDGDALRLIEEELNLGEYGEGTAVYYFEDGDLFYVVEDEVRVRLDPEATGRRDTVRTRIAFGSEDEVIAAEQTVNGTPQPVRTVEIEGVRNHAAVLRERAREIIGTVPATGPS